MQKSDLRSSKKCQDPGDFMLFGKKRVRATSYLADVPNYPAFWATGLGARNDKARAIAWLGPGRLQCQ